jgi:hypothetical protein
MCRIRTALLAPAFAIALTALAASPAARASGDGSAIAESLFREGKHLMAEGRFREACPKLAESHRLGPAPGTLLALAWCHEHEGKSASAWAEYVEAATQAKRDGRSDREEGARERAEALAPTLSRVTIVVDDATRSLEGLEVRCDGTVLREGAWGEALPIDPGEHVVEATARGGAQFRGALAVKPGGDRQTLIVSMSARAADAAPSSAPTSTAAPEQAEGDRGRDAFRALGYAGVGAGVAGAAIGTYFAFAAVKSDRASKEGPDGCNAASECGEAGRDDRLRAQREATAATIAFVAGSALATAGIVALVIAPRRTRARVALEVSPVVAPTFGGVGLRGGF